MATKVKKNPFFWLGFLGFEGLLGWGNPQLGVFVLFFFFFYFHNVPQDELFRQNVHKAGLRGLYTYLAATVLAITITNCYNIDLGEGLAWPAISTELIITTFSWIFVLTLSVFVFSLMYYCYQEKKSLLEPGEPLNKQGVFAEMKAYIAVKPGRGVLLLYLLLQVLLIPVGFAISFITKTSGNLYSVIATIATAVVTILVFCELYPFSLLGFKREGLTRGLLLGVAAMLLTGILTCLPLTAPLFSSFGEFAPLLGSVVFGVFYMLILAFGGELLRHGLVLNILMEGWGHSRKGVYRALLFSSAIFALIAGLFNLTVSPLFALSIFCGVFFINVFLGALYLRSGNLWLPIIVYACADIMQTVWGYLTIEGYSLYYHTQDPGQIWRGILVHLPLLALGLVLARGIEPRPPRRTVDITEPEVNPYVENPA